jgi:hypothetical protein
MTDTAKSSKRTSLEEGSQSPISHSICGILGLGNEPGRECPTEALQVANQDLQSETTDPESISKQGKRSLLFIAVVLSYKTIYMLAMPIDEYNKNILNKLEINV